MKDETMTDSDAPEWPDPGDRTHAVEQAKRLRNQVNEGGLRFEAYLPPSLALWLLDLIEQGKASLDDPLDDYLPAGQKAPQFDGQRILLRHVVTHTSGLPVVPEV